MELNSVWLAAKAAHEIDVLTMIVAAKHLQAQGNREAALRCEQAAVRLWNVRNGLGEPGLDGAASSMNTRA